MDNKRLFFIAGGLAVAILALLSLGLSAPEFGLVMLGGAVAVAILMFFLTRRRYQRMSDSDKQDRPPPEP